MIETIQRDGLADRAARMGDYLLAGFERLLDGIEGVVEIRGRGLMIGIELDRPCGDLVPPALAAGLLINVAAERVVRLLPPLILEQGQADLLLQELSSLIRRVLETPSDATAPEN